MRKLIFVLSIIIPLALSFNNAVDPQEIGSTLTKALYYLKYRQDDLALLEFEKMLECEPDNVSALWGKAEVLRRRRKFSQAEEFINKALSISTGHPSCLISLAYIRYYAGRLNEALGLLEGVLKQPNLDREDEALAYMLLGSINATRVRQGGLLCKLAYGMRIRGYFEKAKRLAPDLSEVHLGLGTFYLLAPTIIGGNLDKAEVELERAVLLTPDFATANARLAQVYKRKADLKKYKFYLRRAKELDPQNEVLKEIVSMTNNKIQMTK